jgi:hypothetical protein
VRSGSQLLEVFSFDIILTDISIVRWSSPSTPASATTSRVDNRTPQRAGYAAAAYPWDCAGNSGAHPPRPINSLGMSLRRSSRLQSPLFCL